MYDDNSLDSEEVLGDRDRAKSVRRAPTADDQGEHRRCGAYLPAGLVEEKFAGVDLVAEVIGHRLCGPGRPGVEAVHGDRPDGNRTGDNLPSRCFVVTRLCSERELCKIRHCLTPLLMVDSPAFLGSQESFKYGMGSFATRPTVR